LPTNLMVVVAWDVQGGFNVLPYQKLEWNERRYMLFLQYWVGRGVQKWLKIMASYMIKVLPTHQIVFRMLSNIGDGEFYNLPIVLSSFHVTDLIPWMNSYFLGNDLWMKRTFRVGRQKVIYYHVQLCMQKLFVTFRILADESTSVKFVKRLYT
jgi:hypothetical protein